jgi:serine/threonine protein kinase
VVHGSSVYHILATTYHKNDPVAATDLFLYGLLLVQAVAKLNSFEILHGGIKREHVLWDSAEKVVRLADFGHAQPEAVAGSWPIIPDFGAPEVDAGERNSRMSDAFSVGKTLQYIMAKFRKDPEDSGIDAKMSLLSEVADALAQESLSMRLSLEEAEKRLQSGLNASIEADLSGKRSACGNSDANQLPTHKQAKKTHG